MKHMKPAAIDPEEMFPQVERIIYQLAHRFSRTYPVPYNECLSEGYWAFMEACRRYDTKRKAKFSSFVYFLTWTRLKNLIRHRSKEPLCFVDTVKHDAWLTAHATQDKSKVLELIDDLSEDAKEIVGLLIETPQDFIGMEMTPRQLLRKVRALLVRRGHKKRALRRACKELRNRFQGPE